MSLETDLKYYEAHVAGWTKEHFGEYVVVKDDNVLGFFAAEDEALAAGAAAYGATPFLVRKIGEPPQQFSAPAMTFGILRANP